MNTAMGKVDDNKKLKLTSMLDSAFQLFTDKGIAKTSISDIVESSGVAKGTFYLFPGIEKTGLSAEDFCQALLERAHVLVTPGTLFGSTGAGHFRIACTVGLDRLKEAFDRMEGLSF